MKILSNFVAFLENTNSTYRVFENIWWALYSIGMTLNTIPSVAGVDENGEPTDNPKLAMLEVLDKFHSAIFNWMVKLEW